MPECIVCKGYHKAGEKCNRCGSDNTLWNDWRATQDEEKEGIEGLLAFYKPTFLPFLLTGFALACGLIGIEFWEGITLAVRLLAVVVTVCLCLVAAHAAYGARHDIREQELLQRVKRGHRALLGGIRLRAVVLPGLSLLLMVVVAYSMTTSSMPGKLARWFFMDQAYLDQVEQEETTNDTTTEEGQPDQDEMDDLRKKIRLVLPFMLMGSYVTFMISITYATSLLSALSYAQKMNDALPQPIFLREDLLVKVVQREAGRAVHRAITPRVIGGAKTPTGTTQGARSWTWDEMERTADGGIRLKAIVRAGSKTEESLTGERTERPIYATYEVEADPWSRITKVGRMKEEEKK